MERNTSTSIPHFEEEVSDGTGLDNKDIPAQTSYDFFKERNGVRFAGLHLLIDCYGCCDISSPELVEGCLRSAAKAAGATLLHIHLHHFTPDGGISGVAVLAESHISFHSWPEHDFAALDVFMCGGADPHKTVEVIENSFTPGDMKITELMRGRDVLEWNAGSKKSSI